MSEIGPAIEKTEIGDQDALSLFLWYETQCTGNIVLDDQEETDDDDDNDQENGKGQGGEQSKPSQWEPYLSSLPTSKELDLTLFWSDDDLYQLIGSPIVDYTERRKNAIKTSYGKKEKKTMCFLFNLI